jgi:hypothetical protein
MDFIWFNIKKDPKVRTSIISQTFVLEVVSSTGESRRFDFNPETATTNIHEYIVYVSVIGASVTVVLTDNSRLVTNL